MAEHGTLARNGFTWINRQIQITFTVDLLMLSVNTPGRAIIKSFIQFNCPYESSWGKTSGARVKKCKGHVQTYLNEPKHFFNNLEES